MGVVELLSLDGQVLSAIQWPVGLLQRLVADLQSSIGGNVKTDALRLLGLPTLPGMNYQLTWEPQNTWWEVRFSGDVTLSLQPERLGIQALTYQNSSLFKDLLAYPETETQKPTISLQKLRFPGLFHLACGWQRAGRSSSTSAYREGG